MAKQWSKAPDMQIDPNKKYTAILHTEKGDITIELFAKEAPNTVNNFVFLSRQGYYDGLTFHRVMHDFMAQTGDSDPRELGVGGPGYTIPDERSALALKHHVGSVSMANTGKPNTGGGQFFITYVAPTWLDGKHAVFGKITNGMDVLRSIKERREPEKATYHGDRIQSVEIIEV